MRGLLGNIQITFTFRFSRSACLSFSHEFLLCSDVLNEILKLKFNDGPQTINPRYHHLFPTLMGGECQ
jgi:hypothetical protein